MAELLRRTITPWFTLAQWRAARISLQPYRNRPRQRPDQAAQALTKLS